MILLFFEDVAAAAAPPYALISPTKNVM